MKKLIGIYSPAPGCGKSTIASWLVEERGYTVVPFAQTLKLMLHPMLMSLGYDSDEANALLERNKSVVVPHAEVSVRHMLRTLGTEWGRACIGPDIWLKCWRERMSYYDRVVVDDCRFLNEAKLIKSLGGDLWWVDRPDVQRAYDHASEGGLDDYGDFDCAIFNEGSIQDLVTKLRLLAKT